MGDIFPPGKQVELHDKDITHIFSLFAKDELLKCADLGYVLKAFNVHLTHEEYDVYKRDHETGLSQEEVKRIIETKWKETNYIEMVKEAFSQLEDGTGYFGIAELRHYIRSLGEKLTDDEVDQMIEFADEDKDEKIKCAYCFLVFIHNHIQFA